MVYKISLAEELQTPIQRSIIHEYDSHILPTIGDIIILPSKSVFVVKTRIILSEEMSNALVCIGTITKKY